MCENVINAPLKELQNAYLDTVHRLALAAEFKDENTGIHIIRISKNCVLLAETIGMSDKEAQNIRYTAPMHDIVKMGIPDTILMKKGKLTDEEFAL